MRLQKALAFFVLFSASSLAVLAADTTATLVLTGGRVWTGDPARPWAGALAGDRLLAVGSAAEIATVASPAMPLQRRRVLA